MPGAGNNLSNCTLIELIAFEFVNEVLQWSQTRQKSTELRPQISTRVDFKTNQAN